MSRSSSSRTMLRSLCAAPPCLRTSSSNRIISSGFNLKLLSLNSRSISSSSSRSLLVESDPAPIPRAAPIAASRQQRFSRRHPYIFYSAVIPLTFVGSLALLVGGLLIHDAFTYQERHLERVPTEGFKIQEASRGGAKNLKIARVLVDDDDIGGSSPGAGEGAAVVKEPRKNLVIIGGGWGAVGVIKHLDPDLWHVTLVSDSNYFLFHPLLPSATVGTVEVRSLCEPWRKIVARVKGHFLQSRACGLEMSERLVEIEGQGGEENFYLPYDRIILAMGSVNSTHGVPGLEHCFQLKTVSDAQGIRRRIMENLERAALPGVSEKERKRLLSFVVCGGGPTGVEFASELYDMINEDVLDYMPKILRQDTTVHIIQSRDHILNTYSEKISKYAEAKFARNEIDTVVNARVKQVTADSVTYTTKDADGKAVEHTIPSGFTLWSTGIAMNPFTSLVASLLPNQYHKHALEVDSHLRVLGAPLGTVYAIGDCATIETRLVDHLLDMVQKCDANGDGVIDQKEFGRMMEIVDKRFPTAQIHVDKIYDIFEKYASKDEHVLDLDQLASMFLAISKSMTALPATAQVASQEGAYLGKKLSKIAAGGHDIAVANEIFDDDSLNPVFRYKHMGSLAYIGNSAVFDINNFSFAGGLVAMYLWRGVYWSEQVSFRTRFLLMLDWIKRGIWGRDLSKF